MANVVPSWLKPFPRDRDAEEARDLYASASRPISLAEVNSWETQWQRLLFRVLVPVYTLVRFQVDPITLTDRNDQPAVRIIEGQEGRSIRLELYHEAGADDALMELELADTSFNQIEIMWIAIQDPTSPRFDVDRMPDGQTTMRGIMRRNLPAEEAAMRAGLAPGQIRQGLRSLSQSASRMESFMACLSQRDYVAQPLYYHTAVLFERLGFAYSQGQMRMEEIHRGFSRGGSLRERLDGSTPFRRPELADTIRGRSWAIHDQVLDQPWDRVRMVKRLGVDAQVCTCPGVEW